MRQFIYSFVVVAITGLFASANAAQFSGLGLGGEADTPSEPAKHSAKLYVVEGTRTGVLEYELQLPEKHNTYATTHPKDSGEGMPSTLKLPDPKKTGKSSGVTLLGPWVPTEEPTLIVKKGKELQEHFGTVVWRAVIEFDEGSDPKELKLKVAFNGQMCNDKLCSLIPNSAAVKFGGPIDRAIADKLPRFEKKNEKTEEPKAAAKVDKPKEEERESGPMLLSRSKVLDDLQIQRPDGGKEQEYSLPVIILIALAGGFILNFMPCVLPVISLKIAGFVQQAGESSGRVILLNLAYSLGLLFVFMVLATLTSFWSFGWGTQNQSLLFNLVMASVVFAMGLSMIGVWEIPIPGLAMSSGANKMSQKEGPQGAFIKGVLTTLLAVPCSGPGLATALTYCLNKPPHIVYAIFFFLALGMAAPYLIIGAFPSLIRFLPKPGPWMETFKQVMGFVLLGTVVYLISYIPPQYLLSTIALFFGIWMGCWCYGRVPTWESLGKRLLAATVGAAIVANVAVVGFFWLDDVMLERIERNALKIADEVNARIAAGETKEADHLPWQPYSIEKLGKLTSERKTVMVDFTADWCPTCKVLEKTVLNTAASKEAVLQNQVETLLADWTSVDEEITETLEKLGSNKQIPVLAIFPADNPKRPIVLVGMYSQQTLIEALNRAGPSKGESEAVVSGGAGEAVRTLASKAKEKGLGSR